MSAPSLKQTDHQQIIQLQQEIERLSDFADLSSDWFWEQDKELRFIGFSGTGIDRISRKQTDFIGRTRWEMPISPTSHDAMLKHKACCERHEAFHDFQYEIFSSTGELQRFSVSGTPVFSPTGEFCGYRGTGINITELHKTKQVLKESQQKLAQIVVGNPIASFVIDQNHIITHWNKACELLTSVPAEEAIGTKDAWRGFYSQERPVMANLVLDNAIDEMIEAHYGNKFTPSALIPGAYEAEDYFPHMQDGIWLFFTAAPLLDEMGNKIGAIETLQDITRQKKQEEEIIHQAHFDSLTQLPNRFLSLDRLQLMMEEAKRNQQLLAVLFLDLDDFKKINDTLGHAKGDELLVQAAQRLRKSIRGSDTVGRLGGDEFIILLNNIKHAKDARPVAENILKSFRDPFVISDRELLLTASVGISIYPDDGLEPAALLRNADSAMYFSKAQGRNAYHYFTEDMNKGITRRLALEEQLSNALVNKEFQLVYQPVIDLQATTIVGAEALLRWNNPTLGNISPEEFIPIIEQTGLIMPIGYFVLEEALRNAQIWSRLCRRNFRMAVNLSPLQFRDPKLIQRIQHTLQNAGLTGDKLILEVTEGVLLGNQMHIQEAFSRLTQMGIQISMDDFGTGYSSLNYLRNFPFHTLKIDRDFIRNFEDDKTAPALIDATLSMAQALGLEVVAEGVETRIQSEYLKERQCNFAQGYLFSKPVDKATFEQLLVEGIEAEPET